MPSLPLSAILILLIVTWSQASPAPWQCRPGLADLNTIYPDLAPNLQENRTIGEGTDGQVLFSTSSATALKRFFPESTSADRIHDEYWIGRTLVHPNIVATHSLNYVGSDTRGYWEMEMEYVPFALLDLLDYDRWAERPWSFDAISCLFAQIIDAVAHMHENGIAHRDLKVENIMVARDGTVKVIDFGSAAVSRNLLTGARIGSWANWIGTPITMAPEVHGERFFDMEKADVWSLAVVFVRLWLGVYPWEPEMILGGLEENEAFGVYAEETRDKRVCGEAEDEDRLLCQIPLEKARLVIAAMLELDPMRRSTLPVVLNSDWLGETFNQMLRNKSAST
ncbi:hypothetical protein COCC4DRAFT_30582 [Bipolaris maydis ATCC 48331]|uniref:non-specific serine/threonine protein kinase n=2 Tax=Cochliobolus heterostrophus TaxID=5016 RepID=M2UWH6_COCH5|nr:uncharacterized protein COCC4DRAFT_30582 [Bipolaris maydis ATCC 48331]EMD92183.1 hypothetical protein COCHEDRAFT_1021082 [Bipolaris maydis C5]KAH7550811.1 hypothetical protein BM1_10184 [Bipolaris maydis]ENI07874.1 hypothetical protein COCC4DRAFT_30582 [Bipolaris maydis ATCC 48331]KAJ5022042.1 kinase-like domain-containing protein [Bipolaris maydis]KAJ6197862.1 kinase-like domain-containing protein [Bipolaris maydis]